MMSPASLKAMATSEPVEPGTTTSSTAKPGSGVNRSLTAGRSAQTAAETIPKTTHAIAAQRARKTIPSHRRFASGGKRETSLAGGKSGAYAAALCQGTSINQAPERRTCRPPKRKSLPIFRRPRRLTNGGHQLKLTRSPNVSGGTCSARSESCVEFFAGPYPRAGDDRHEKAIDPDRRA